MPSRAAAAIAFIVVVAIAQHAWAATPQSAPTIQPIPVETTIGPSQDNASKDNSTTLLTYNCTGGIQVTLPEEVTGGSPSIIIVVHSDGEHKVKCNLTSTYTQDTPDGAKTPGIQAQPQAYSEDKEPPAAPPEVSNDSIQVETATNLTATIQRASTTTQTTGKPTTPKETTQATHESPPIIPTSTSLSEERLMITLLGGIIAGLAALAIWRILLS